MKQREIFIYPTKKELKGIVRFANDLHSKNRPITGRFMGLMYMIYDFIKISVSAKRRGLGYATYRIWFFRTEADRMRFKRKLEKINKV